MKRRNKVSAEFNMSSLTDIIFLLLIFFMLTSAAIQINIELPESTSRTVAPTDISVMLTTDGVVKFNGKVSSKGKLSGQIRDARNSSENKENATVNIISQTGVPWEEVADIMEISNTLGMRAIISTQPPK